MTTIMAKNLENTAKNNEKNLENLEIVKKKNWQTPCKWTLGLKGWVFKILRGLKSYL